MMIKKLLTVQPGKFILGIEPYVIEYRNVKIKLDANENPYNLPKSIIRKLQNKLRAYLFNRYPDPEARELTEKIADFNKVSPEKILIGNGSDELLQLITLAYTDYLDTTMSFDPSFAIYKQVSETSKARVNLIPLNKYFHIDPIITLRAIDVRKPKIIFIANPNNPTAKCFNEDMILKIINKTNGLVVIDEAYFEFSGQSFFRYLTQYENIIILRTLSKAFGLAGLRLGYMIAHPEIVQEVKKVKLPYNINSFSQMVAMLMLDNYSIIKKHVNIILKQRDFLSKAIKEMPGLHPLPTDSNFILFRSGKKSTEIYEYLLSKNILIRKFSEDTFLRNYLRVTVGKPHENKKFIQELRGILNATS